MQAGISTANAISPITAVMNHAQVENGMRASDMPLVRRSSVVAMKFRAPSSCATQKMAIEIAHSVWPSPWPGPASFPTALRGAYAVHPDRAGPSATKNEEISTRNATSVTQKDVMLIRGNAMSSAPTCRGRK